MYYGNNDGKDLTWGKLKELLVDVPDDALIITCVDGRDGEYATCSSVDVTKVVPPGSNALIDMNDIDDDIEGGVDCIVF